MPGLVYKYLPMLAEHFNWDAEQKLWFAFLNGMTQNPITSLRLFEQLKEPTTQLDKFDKWFFDNWHELQFDTDRRYGKKETVLAIKDYSQKIKEYGSQENMLRKGKSFSELWEIATNIHSFGRLSSFSYLEYVYISDFGSDCDNLLFEDISGSKSHRNGALLLNNRDDIVYDKRAFNDFDGNYEDFPGMCDWLTKESEKFIEEFKKENPDISKYAGNFTLESNYCTFKNHFFAKRYPGVYADMAYERILWAEDKGVNVDLFREMYSTLPEELKYGKDKRTVNQRAKTMLDTGKPYRLEVLGNFKIEKETKIGLEEFL